MPTKVAETMPSPCLETNMPCQSPTCCHSCWTSPMLGTKSAKAADATSKGANV